MGAYGRSAELWVSRCLSFFISTIQTVNITPASGLVVDDGMRC